MKSLTSIFLLIFTLASYGQTNIDSISTINNKLKFDQLKAHTNTYLVYFQDSIDGPKHNMEIWERTISKTQRKNRDVYQFIWNRFFSTGSSFKYKILADIGNFSPVSEEITIQRINNDSLTIDKRYFIYEKNSIYTSSDTNKHNGNPFRLDDLNNSFNFEMDMETFSMLPFEEGKSFAINFYHPGSNTLPKYYTYAFERSEKIYFNNQEYSCWVLKVIYPGHGHAEFWIDKETNTTLKMKEIYDGKLRFKLLVI